MVWAITPCPTFLPQLAQDDLGPHSLPLMSSISVHGACGECMRMRDA